MFFGNGKKKIECWDIEEKQPQQKYIIEDLQGEVTALALSGDSTKLFSGGLDKIIYCWDATYN